MAKGGSYTINPKTGKTALNQRTDDPHADGKPATSKPAQTNKPVSKSNRGAVK